MNITVYCGSSTGNDPKYSQSAEKLGQWIASNGHQLIYGGSKSGLMRVLADSVMKNGGKVKGIMPSFMIEKEIAYREIHEFVEVKNMVERKKLMFELGDVYIALAGGSGTLEEISEMISWARIGQNDNPCIFFDEHGYYQPLKNMFDRMVEEGFLREEDRKDIFFVKEKEEIEKILRDYIAPRLRK